jgi:sarcosine oxidase, subunit gamma
MLESRSALGAFLPKSGRDGARGGRRLRIGEAPLAPLLQIGVYPRGAEAAKAGAAAVLGAPLPESTVVAGRGDGYLAYRIAADQYWIQGGARDLALRLRAALPTDAASLTPLDGARTCLVIEGPASRDLLARLVAVDVDTDVFAIGHFAQTPIHHVGGLLYRASQERYEFIALRTFAASTWEIVEDAARIFGYDLIGGAT